MALTLEHVPQDIKEFFGSEQTTALLGDISSRAGNLFPGTMPYLLYLLEIKTMSVHDFVEVIQRELSCDPQKAASIAKAIKEEILEPQRYALAQWGIDISFLDVASAPPLEEFFESGEARKAKTKTFSPETINGSEKTEGEAEIQIETPLPVESKTGEDKPLILHREETLTEEKRSSFKGFGFPLGFFKSKRTEPETRPSVRVSIETPSETDAKTEEQIPIKKKDGKRVVHYSEFRTPLNPFSEPDEFINLETFAKAPTPTKDPKIKKEEAPLPPISNKRPQSTTLFSKTEPPTAETPKPVAPVFVKPITPKEVQTTTTPEESGKKFFWFLKNKTKISPKDQSPDQPKIEGNVVDLRQTTNDL